MNEQSYPYNMSTSNPFELVKSWMLKFDRGVDQPFTFRDIQLCMNLISEEEAEVYQELVPEDGHGRIRDKEDLETHINREKLTKELCDLIWVAIFCGVKFGLPLDAAFRRIYDSNMSKLQDDGTPLLREDGKILKSPNYKSADLSDLF